MVEKLNSELSTSKTRKSELGLIIGEIQHKLERIQNKKAKRIIKKRKQQMREMMEKRQKEVEELRK